MPALWSAVPFTVSAVADLSGGVQLSISVSLEELTSWPPERAAAFLDGIAKVIHALGEQSAPPRRQGNSRARDEVRAFIDGCCDQSPALLVSSQELYAAYLTWPGGSPRRLTLREFGLSLTAMGFERTKAGRSWLWHWRYLSPHPDIASPLGPGA